MGIALIFLVVISWVPVFCTTVTGYENITGYQTATSTGTITDSTTDPGTSTTETASTQGPSYEYSPFQVSLHYSYNDDFICGGSIVTRKVVLTAAHCMYYRWGGLMPPIIVTVAAGRPKLNETAWKTFGVATITLHPLFNKTSMENNLALIEIEDTFETDNFIGQIDIEKNNTSAGYEKCIVTGWNEETYEYQAMEVIVIDCANYPQHICTNKKYLDDTTCINNAGNPLVCDNKLVGVLSVEPGCEDPSQLSIFENIRHSMSWLNDTLGLSSSSEKINAAYAFNLFLVYVFTFFKSIFHIV